MRCECQRLKKEWLCSEVQAAQRASQEEKSRTLIGLLPCDQICLKLAAEKKAKEETEQQLRQRRAKEAEVIQIAVNYDQPLDESFAVVASFSPRSERLEQ